MIMGIGGEGGTYVRTYAPFSPDNRAETKGWHAFFNALIPSAV